MKVRSGMNELARVICMPLAHRSTARVDEECRERERERSVRV